MNNEKYSQKTLLTRGGRGGRWGAESNDSKKEWLSIKSFNPLCVGLCESRDDICSHLFMTYVNVGGCVVHPCVVVKEEVLALGVSVKALA
jgi:hypothetical protein